MITLSLNSTLCWTMMITLLHVSWIGVVVGALAAIAGRVLLNQSAISKYRTNWFFLLLFFASLPVSFALSHRAADETSNSPESEVHSLLMIESEAHVPQDGVSFQPAETLASSSEGLSSTDPPDAARTAEAMPEPSVVSASSLWNEFGRIARLAAPFITVFYILGVLLMFLSTANSARVSRRLRLQSEIIVDTWLFALLKGQSTRLGLRVLPIIATCQHIAVPIVVGIFRPMILFPTAMLTGLTATQLEAVLTHELAHLRRRDQVVIVLQRVLEAMLFFHPVTWYLSRRIHHERECCCDELVLSLGTDRLIYANTLLRVAEMRLLSPASQSISTSLAADGRQPSSLRRRIMNIVAPERHESIRVTAWPIVAGFVCAIFSTYVAASTILRPANSLDESAKTIEPATGKTTVSKQYPLSVPKKADAGTPQDADGFPLAEGLVQKFGSSRFRTGARAWQTVRFSQDGEWLWCKADGLSVIHRETGHVIRAKELGIDGMAISAINVSTKSNRAVVAATSGKPKSYVSTIFIMNSNTGEQVSSFKWNSGDFFASAIAISDDASRILTIGYRDARLWDADTGTELQRIDSGTPLKGAAFSPDGKRIMLVGMGGGLDDGSLFWDLSAADKPISLEPKVHRQISVCSSPNGRFFATAAIFEKDAVRLWNAMDGSLSRHLKGTGSTGHADGGFCFTPDSKMLLVPATDANVIEAWDVENGQLQHTLPSQRPRSVSVSPDGKWLASLGDSQRLSIFDLAAQKEVTPETSPHFANVAAVRFLGTDRILTVDADNVASAWSKRTGQLEWEGSTLEGLCTGAVAVSHKENLIAINPVAEAMQIIDIENGREAFKLTSNARFGGSRAVEFTPNGETLMTWTDASEVVAWDTKTGKESFSLAINVPGYLYEPSRPFVAPIACFSPDATSLFAAFQNKLYKFDTETGVLEKTTIADNTSRMIASPDGRWLVTEEKRTQPNKSGTIEHLLHVRNASTLEPVFLLANSEDYFPTFNFSSDSNLLASYNSQGAVGVTIVDIASKKIVARLPQVYDCTEIQFSADDQQLATGHGNGTAMLWDLQSFRLKDPIDIETF